MSSTRSDRQDVASGLSSSVVAPIDDDNVEECDVFIEAPGDEIMTTSCMEGNQLNCQSTTADEQFNADSTASTLSSYRASGMRTMISRDRVTTV